jgi:GNAT superfamily N-acetyltransferase
MGGTILEIDPPRLLRLVAALLVTPATSDDPPHRVTWEITPAGPRTMLRVTCDGYPAENATYRLNETGMDGILKGLAAVVDSDLAGQLQRLDRIGPPVVRELTPERADDLLGFFDGEAFRDNPAWASCYCMGHHFSGDAEEWARRSAAENRGDQEARIRSGRAHGLIAYVDDHPVGWCNACARNELLAFDRRPELRTDDAERVGSIHCFVISPRYRRHGIARLLLNAACDHLRTLGFEIAEAYPGREAGSDAQAYRGTLPMYLAAGFQPYREGRGIVLVRKSL